MNKLICLFAIASSACMVNGKPLFSGGASGPLARAGGGGGSTSTGSSGDATPSSSGDATQSSAASAPTAAPTACRLPVRSGDHYDLPPFPDRPADPMLGVDRGQPVSLKDTQHVSLAPRDAAQSPVCDAAHDHCMRPCGWLRPVGRDPYFAVFVQHVNDGWQQAVDGSPSKWHDGDEAFATVPATRGNLRVGQQVFALPDGLRVPRDEIEALGQWRIGTVASIDWAAGTAVLTTRLPIDPVFLSAVRVPVLRYDGHRVTPIDGVVATAPRLDEVIAPAARATGLEDPWAQVDASGQPKRSTDTVALTSAQQECGPTWNHCLRPDVWFLDIPGYGPTAVRWDGQAFVSPAELHLDPGRKAYRTRPAKVGELRVGQRVIYDSAFHGNGSERDAYAQDRWRFGDVTAVDRNGAVTLDTTSATVPAAGVRVMVLWWMPGERAEAVE